MYVQVKELFTKGKKNRQGSDDLQTILNRAKSKRAKVKIKHS